MQRLLPIVLVVLSPLISAANEPKIGDRVFVKPDAEETVNDSKVNLKTIPIPATVVEIRDEKVLLGKAWVRKNDVMTADEAFGFYNERIRRHPTKSHLWTTRGLVRQEFFQRSQAGINDRIEAILLTPSDLKIQGYRERPSGMEPDLDKALEDFKQAVRLDANDATALGSIARLRATCPDGRYRDGREAVESATKACELTAWKDGKWLDTLAAAYAETGDFTNAVKWQEKSVEIASDNEPDGASERLELYRSNKPHHDILKKPSILVANLTRSSPDAYVRRKSTTIRR